MVFTGISNIHKGKLLIYEKQLHLLSVLPWTLSPVCFIKCRYFFTRNYPLVSPGGERANQSECYGNFCIEGECNKPNSSGFRLC